MSESESNNTVSSQIVGKLTCPFPLKVVDADNNAVWTLYESGRVEWGKPMSVIAQKKLYQAAQWGNNLGFIIGCIALSEIARLRKELEAQ